MVHDLRIFDRIYNESTNKGETNMIPPSNDFSDIQRPEATKPTVVTGGDNEKVSDKVKRLRESIANGTYQINTRAIAQKMVDSGILDK